MDVNWKLFAAYYLLSCPGDKIIICDNGKIYKTHDGKVISDCRNVSLDHKKYIVFDAPGEDEFPCEVELESLVEWDEHVGLYVKLETREYIGDLEEAIKYCIEFGDMADLFNEWKEEYNKKIKERDEIK